ncbi:carbohydrate ABC transporter permease [Paenibacillus mucilaginosus]|uniref:Sugar ABC transporter permease n=3 Tax=Paenibacillus mucilaginosus TaxID=61624 RepID=I0BTA6_9BACL|nr:carbohydrate ABC transporter permease [Paenibacillus mucilaginosus]AEI45597.1 binding-protein-dependent transport systems inner membrane component [Paenibacillus mucilaginosus KNP414]AFH65603.1 sugar ABC transporter permease [Paenibacillus mucilaginosus K02]MCG7215344.1 carbohydrate ABC transporter permease [Paenibacillus mucilaginosus]WDM27005.1 carbohydrate ABC transporter permease [Paenibacillus mucilaginosus]
MSAGMNAIMEKPRPEVRTRRRSFGIVKGGVLLFLSTLVVTQLYPLLWLLTYSLKTNEEILSGSFFSLPQVAQWSNYTDALEAGNYWRYLFNSFFVTSVTMASVIVLAAMAAYAITRFQWKYGQLLMLIFLLGMMIPLQSTLLPLMIIFKNMGILNTHLALILPYVAFSTPLAVFILSGFLKTIPHELEESAVMDGANVYRTFWSIILPISVPPIMTVCILTFINIWNEYILASTFISAERLKTLPFGVNSFVSQYSVNYGAIGAFLVLGALPVIVIYFLLSEKITKGMVAGAVKG